ncbi:MAG: PhzF family phenazine biosynthesis protein [Sneathiellales bacterium]|nr:PhzF family phenazine biosynthesis protein [Sneathiellales bacterium]
MSLKRISAFSSNGEGGNPAGVLVADTLPSAEKMQAIAKDVGYSETAFITPMGKKWRIRYFAPEQEVPFCGHATIATTAELGRRYGPGQFELVLNDSEISVEALEIGAEKWGAALTSPPTASSPAPKELTEKVLPIFNLTHDDLDDRFPLTIATAGAWHFLIALKNRQILQDMSYDFERLKKVMIEAELTTINLYFVQDDKTVHSRNPFASGGVYEDPATGAAAAALGGFFRDIGWKKEGKIIIHQGYDMKAPSDLHVEITPEKGKGIRVSGETRIIAD